MTASASFDPAAPTLTALQADDVADYCLRAVGPTKFWLVGVKVARLLGPLRAAGCEIVSPQDVPADLPANCTIIGWADPDTQRQLLSLPAQILILLSTATSAEDEVSLSELARAMEWQQHPAVFALTDAPDDIHVRLLARVGVSISDRHSELRAGYHGLAAALVRPDDAVVAADAADHGLWRILQQQTRCRSLLVLTDMPAPSVDAPGVSWQSRATWQPDAHRADVLVTCIRQEDANWNHELIAARAALVRSGRLVVAVPLTDGRNVNVRALLLALEPLGFVVDRAWWHSLSRPMGADQFTEVARDTDGRILIDADASVQADVLVLMAVNIGGDGVPRNADLQLPNIIAFQRDYLDASVVRLIVAMGLRLESTYLRRHLAQQLLATAPANSADHGAALCVLLYDPVASEGEDRNALLESARHFLQLPAANPTVLRWQVSVAYAAAALWHAAGDLAQAEVLYARVLAFDVMAFSPLLGTKTTAAAVRLGWIQFARGDTAAARQAWLHGLKEAKRLASQADWTEVVGAAESPETFGMPEFTAVMDEAGRLASALRVTAEEPLRPGLAWAWGNQSLHAMLSRARAGQLRRDAWLDRLQNAKDWLDGQYHQLNVELDRRGARLQTLESDNALLVAGNTGAVAAFRLSHQHAEAEKSDLRDRLEQAQQAIARQSDEHARLLEAFAPLSDEHARLLEAFARLSDEHAQLLEAARDLSTATVGILSSVPQPRLPAESIAKEMSRLANVLNQLPWKAAIRSVLRMFALGPVKK
ncbi:hypothetical protein [Stenotrophomonas sp.]|uniref:hypothetical protein n=1 Tax=Stenotrophomonas sp. TaxID=69392 RepID=UPI0028A77944|nr:hypothetical protein [Stenotrophomonas sp.]